MFSIHRAALLPLFCAAVCRGEVWIELVPSPPPPHLPGQVVTLRVYAHSEIPWDRYIKIVQLDFSDSAPCACARAGFCFRLECRRCPAGLHGIPRAARAMDAKPIRIWL